MKTANKWTYGVVMVLLALALQGCGGGTGGSGGSASTSTVVSGAVVKGPVDGAQVCAYTVVANARGALLGSCTTSDATGNYSFTVPANVGQLWIEAIGGSYVDEATNVVSPLSAGGPLRSIVTANAGTVTAMLTPLTTLALNAAIAAAGSGGGTLDAAAFEAAVTQLASTFNLPAGLDIRTTLPSFGTAINSYGTALIAISQMVAAGNANGTTLASLLATSNFQSLATAYAAAIANPVTPPPTPPTTPPTTPPSALTISLSGSITAAATGYNATLTPTRQSYGSALLTVEGFTANISNNRTGYTLTEPTPGPLNYGLGKTVNLTFDANQNLTSVAYRDGTQIDANCSTINNGCTGSVQVSYPNGKSAVTVQMNQLGITRSGLVLNGTVNVVFGSPLLALKSNELPNNITSDLTLDGQPISAKWFDNFRNAPNSNPQGTFNFGAKSNVTLTGSASAFLSVDRPLNSSSNERLGTSRFFVEADGSRVAEFANTQFNYFVFDNNSSPPFRIVNSVGLLNGTLRSPTATGQLTSSAGNIDLTGTQSSYSVRNSVVSLTLISRKPAATAEFSSLRFDFDTVARRATTIQLTTANAQGLSCADPLYASDATPACVGVTLGADQLTYTFNNTTLRNQTTGQSIVYSGTLSAVTGE